MVNFIFWSYKALKNMAKIEKQAIDELYRSLVDDLASGRISILGYYESIRAIARYKYKYISLKELNDKLIGVS